MSKHTPGPWMYEPSTQARYSWLVLTADFDEDRNVGTVICRTSDGISEADARLIAAAPDLLEFARECARVDSDCGPMIRDAARAAIARAEGGGR